MLGSSFYLYFSVYFSASGLAVCFLPLCLFIFPSSSSFSCFSPLTGRDVTSISATVLLCALQREVHAEGGVAIVGGAPGPCSAGCWLCESYSASLCLLSSPTGQG